MKRYFTMWQVWAGVAFVLLILLLVGGNKLSGLLPFAVFLICPLMMIFMMKDHHGHEDKEKGGEKHA